VSAGGSPAAGGDWRSYDVCQLLPGAEAAALLGGLTSGGATPEDAAVSPGCRYSFSGGTGPTELTISLHEAADLTARYEEVSDLVFDRDDVELKEFMGVFDEAFGTSTPEDGAEFWVRKGEVAARFQTPGKVDDHKLAIIALAQALMGRL
jgi:hypothetical protein